MKNNSKVGLIISLFMFFIGIMFFVVSLTSIQFSLVSSLYVTIGGIFIFLSVLAFLISFQEEIYKRKRKKSAETIKEIMEDPDMKDKMKVNPMMPISSQNNNSKTTSKIRKMICPKCGEDIDSNSKFCKECGDIIQF